MTAVWADEQQFCFVFFCFVLMSVKEEREVMDREEAELGGKGKAQEETPTTCEHFYSIHHY